MWRGLVRITVDGEASLTYACESATRTGVIDLAAEWLRRHTHDEFEQFVTIVLEPDPALPLGIITDDGTVV